MSRLVVKKMGYFSFAKTYALFSFLFSLFLAIIDLIGFLFFGASMFVGLNTFGAWLVYIIGYLILTPIIAFILGYLVAFFINKALKMGKGLELEVE
jgi:hypothetical protein